MRGQCRGGEGGELVAKRPSSSRSSAAGGRPIGSSCTTASSLQVRLGPRAVLTRRRNTRQPSRRPPLSKMGNDRCRISNRHLAAVDLGALNRRPGAGFRRLKLANERNRQRAGCAQCAYHIGGGEGQKKFYL